jgi:hypothetical protein
MAIDFGRAARGIATGYISEVVKDRERADKEKYENLQYAKRQYFEVDKPAFIKQEEVRENNYNIISGTLSPVYANYGDALGVTLNNESTKLFLKQIKDKSNEEQYRIQSSYIDRKKGRIKSFNERTSEVRESLVNLPGGPGSMNMMNYFFPNEGEDPAEVGIGQGQATGTMDTQTAAAGDIPMMPMKSIMDIEGTTDVNLYSNRDDKVSLENNARLLFFGTETRPTSGRLRDSYSADYDPEKHGPSKEMYGFRKYFENEYLPRKGITYDLPPIYGQKKAQANDGQKFDSSNQQTDISDQAQQIQAIDTSTTFNYQGKNYFIPERFKGQSLTEDIKKSIASQQENMGPTENDPRVMMAQNAINQARAQGDDDAVEAIKDQLRKDLGISNLSELIK